MLHHVTREVRPETLESCVAFYVLLGFRSVPVPPGIGGRALWLESEGDPPTQVHLMPVEHAEPASGHVGVVVDYNPTVKRLREHGHTVRPRREHWGSPRAYVSDPAGNLVELMAWPPDRSPDQRLG